MSQLMLINNYNGPAKIAQKLFLSKSHVRLPHVFRRGKENILEFFKFLVFELLWALLKKIKNLYALICFPFDVIFI